MTTTCATGCGRPAPTAVICPACTGRLERTLAELPNDLRDLQVTITRQANAGRPESTSHGKPGTVVLYDPDDTASKLLMQARNWLSTWIRHLCEQRGIGERRPTGPAHAHLACQHASCKQIHRAETLQPPMLRTTEAMAVWLTAHVRSIAQDEAADDCALRAHDLHAAIRRAIDNLSKLLAGQCTARLKAIDLVPDPGGGIAVGYVERTCGAILRTRHGDRKIRCPDPECGAEYEAVDVWVANLERAREQHMTAADCAGLITRARLGSVTAGQINGMRQRGKLISYQDHPLTGEHLYLIGDLLDLLDRDRRKVSA